MRGRVARWLGIAVLAFLGLTILPVVALRWLDPWSSAFMISARLDSLLNFEWSPNRYEWRDLEQISPQAALAVIAAEDQQFPLHAGFDMKSIREAVQHNASSKRVRGASTISQQVAKNLFLWKGRNYLRKGLEAWFTVLIERLWPKERILEIYLNIAEFAPGVYGAEAAAQELFRKPALKLTRRDSALLAAVLPNPAKLRADAPSAYVRRRADWIQRQMRALGGPKYLEELE